MKPRWPKGSPEHKKRALFLKRRRKALLEDQRKCPVCSGKLDTLKAACSRCLERKRNYQREYLAKNRAEVNKRRRDLWPDYKRRNLARIRSKRMEYYFRKRSAEVSV